MKRLMWLFSFLILLNVYRTALALDTDIYVLSYEEIQVHPDALFVLDLSGSMRWTPAGATMYVSSSCGDVAYYANSETGHSTACTIDPYGTVPKYGEATCSGPFYRTARTISGVNYNSDCSRLGIAKRAIGYLLDSNNDGVVNTDDETDLGIRFGYMRFYDGNDTSGNYSTGNIKLIKGLGTPYSEIAASVNNESANSGTPLASSLNETKLYLNYHKSIDNAADCRAKFVVLITDGADTYACSGSGSEDQSTQYRRRRETIAKAKVLKDAGYRVFVIGFGAQMPHWLRNTLNWAAFYGGTDNPLVSNSGDSNAYNPSSVTSCQSSYTSHHNIEGDGDHYFASTSNNSGIPLNDPGEANLSGYAFLATNASELSDAIKDIARIILALLQDSTAYVAPVVPISQMVSGESGNRMYLGMFKPAPRTCWKGNVKKYGIASAPSGQIEIGDIVDANGNLVMDPVSNLIKDHTTSYWSTGEDGGEDAVDRGGVGTLLFNRVAARNIYTYLETNIDLTDSSNAFNLSNSAITPQKLGLDPNDTTERNNIINFIKGLDAYDWDGDGNATEKRGTNDWPQNWLQDVPQMLGAFVHSKPLIVYYGSNQSVIFAGGNDGMLHAFDDDSGQELWAFVPPNLLPNLKNLKDEGLIKFYADGSPRVYLGSDKKILVFGERRGGDRYIALDITNRTQPKFLWEISPLRAGYGELGQTWSTPQTGKIKNGTGEKWVAFISGGYDENQDNIPVVNPDTKGRGIYVLDILTGDLIWKYTRSENAAMTYSIPSDIAKVDANGDGLTDRLYVGDMGGRMWRFDIGDAGNTGAWTGKIIFNANGKIFYPPDVTLEKDGGIYEMLFFGTGDRENPKGDLTYVNGLYAVKDKNPSSPLTETDLVDVTLDLLQNPSTSDSDKANIRNQLNQKKGWFIKLDQYSGEKCLSSPLVFYGVAYYTTFTPTPPDPTDICYLGRGKGSIYMVDYRTGNAAFNLDVTNDTDVEVISRSDRRKVIGASIPSGVVMTVIGGNAVGYVGVGGGVYHLELGKSKPLIPLNWRIVF